jgi:Tol biopolymer transport system component/tRNA A-37 threonylcarbamoyl transferase component Bud32
MPVVVEGQVLSHYCLRDRIGSGGMGVIYVAEDLHLQRQVAVKVLRSGAVGDEAARKRFRREALALSKFSHPNIATIHDFDTQDGVDFLVMEHVPGQDLRERTRAGPLPENDVFRLGLQLASGLNAAHKEGILHRDLKPHNIRVTPDGQLKILDFGLAKLLEGDSRDWTADALTQTGRLVGTIAYMAPEQVLGRPSDERSDVYAAGALLYEMATGHRPHFEALGAELVDAIRYREPDPPRALRPELISGLEEVILKALHKDPGSRYRSARDLALALEDAGRAADLLSPSPHSGPTSVPASASRPSTWKTRSLARGPETKRRHKLAWLLATVAIAAAVIAFVLVTTREDDPTSHVAVPLSWSPRQLTSDPGIEKEPAVSPDGTFVAYASDKAGSLDIWIADTRGGEALRLTSHPASDRSPAWFPDGSALAFVSDRSGRDAVWKVSRLGGDPVQLVPDGVDPAPSPNGSKLAFATRGPSGRLRIASTEMADTSNVTLVTTEPERPRNDRHPTWSPAGDALCFTDSRDIWIVNADGGDERRLTSDFATDLDPLWTPDGRHVYFSSIRDGTTALWRIDARGGRPMRLTLGTGPEREPTLAGNGQVLAYSTLEQEVDIVILDRLTGTTSRIPGTRDENTPALSPGGDRLVFASNRQGTYDLWIVPLVDGRPDGEPKRLTDQGGSVAVPSFSPDGRWIAYGGSRGNEWDLWLVPPEGGLPRRLTEGPEVEQHPAWSPDGTTIAFSSGSGGEYQIFTATFEEGRRLGDPVRVTRGTGSSSLPTWSPDGETIAYLCDEGGSREVCLSAVGDAAASRRLTTGADARFVRWGRTSGQLLVTGTWGGAEVEPRWVSPETGSGTPLAHRVAAGARETPGDFDLAVDERFIVYSHYRTRGDVWVAEAKPGSI